MGMENSQGTFYFPTTPVQSSELIIQLDDNEEDICPVP